MPAISADSHVMEAAEVYTGLAERFGDDASLETVFKMSRAFNTSPGPLLDPIWRDWRRS